MGKSILSKVMWMGRATVFPVGLSAILAALFGVGSMARLRRTAIPAGDGYRGGRLSGHGIATSHGERNGR